jgi:hypothetical protein
VDAGLDAIWPISSEPLLGDDHGDWRQPPTMNFWTALLPERPHERTLTVEAGQVVCPRRGVTDIEECYICPNFRRVTDDFDGSVRCVPQARVNFPFIGVPR